MISKYLKKTILRGWIVAVGIIEAITIMLDIYGNVDIPNTIYFSVFFVALLFSGYRAYLELLEENFQLEQKVEELEASIQTTQNKSPRMIVGLHNDRKIEDQITLNLNPIPDEPDYKALINTRRDSLLAESEKELDYEHLLVKLSVASSASHEKKVEEYLLEYETFLQEQYQYSIELDRIRSFIPGLRNLGTTPADDIVIELTFPSEIKIPSEYRMIRHFYPKHNKPTPPSEPKLASFRSIEAIVSDFSLPLIEPNIPSEPPKNIEGPIYGIKSDGINTITYKVNRLLHNRDELDFEPFALGLAEINQNTTLSISTKIFSAELPTPTDKTLIIKVRINIS